MTYGKCEICEVKTETKNGNKNDFHGKISHKLKLVKICKENIKKRSWAEDNYDDKLRKKIQRTVIKWTQIKLKTEKLLCKMRSVVEIGATVPAFLGKLWKLVNDSETNHLISWSPGGKTFVIKNQADFARELLPLYYKHNNMASFIRQLNMYGFHKITSVENGGLRYEKDEIEFSHPCFMRGHAYLLEHIKRKIANPKSMVASNESGEKILIKPELMNKVLTDVKQMKGKQESLDAKFSAMKQENEALWREVAILRQKHIKQQQIVNNLIQFLMSLVQPARPANANGNNVGVKRPYQLMINNAAHNTSSDNNSYPGKFKNVKLDKDLLEELNEDNLEDGPTIHELAHDDILQNDSSQDALNPSNFVYVEIPSASNATTGHSPNNPSSSIQYQVTMEDGEEADLDGTRTVYPIARTRLPHALETQPIVTSPSPVATTTDPLNQSISQPLISNVISIAPKHKAHNTENKTAPLSGKSLLSQSNFNINNPSADPKLPADIFASDDSVSDAGVTATEDVFQNVLQDALVSPDPIVSTSKDKMLGGIKLEKVADKSKIPKRSKKAQKVTENSDVTKIKTELQDDLEWNNMSLATLNNNIGVNKFQSMNRRDNYNKNREDLSSLLGSNKNDIDDHLDSMQTDLDSLRELLRSDSYSLDPNTLMGLFGSDDPFYGLSFTPLEERTKSVTPNSAKKQKGESLNISSDGSRTHDFIAEDDGNMPDFEDINMPELEGEGTQDACVSPVPSESTTLNTPQVHLRSPYVLQP